jgi:hypothetical protein
MKWECLAVTFDEVNSFVASLEKSRDPNEKVLRKRVADDLLPLLEKQEEARKRKQAQKERELLNLEKLATAKRSSRIAGRLEQQKQDEEAQEAERKKKAELAMAKKEQEKWMKLEKERESRMMTREQRLKEREARRILHEEELANLSEDNKKLASGEAAGRLSERHLKAEIERKKQALEELAEEEDWIFDCICGAYGQIDDGTHSIACDQCNIWQHSKCVGVSQAEADREDFHFICNTCDRRAKDAERAKTQPPIKIKIGRPGSSSSPAVPKQNGASGASLGGASHSNVTERPKPSHQSPHQGTPQVTMQSGQSNQSNGPQMALWQTPYVPQHIAGAGAQSSSRPQEQLSSMSSTERVPKMTPVPSPSLYTSSTGVAYPPHSTSRPSSSHAFSPPHLNGPTNLPPPMQTPSYSFANGSASQYSNQPLKTPRAHSPPAQQSVTGYSPVQGSPSPAAPGYATHSSTMAVNGQHSVPNIDPLRRNSVNLPSPLASTPILTPRVTGNYANLMSSSPPVNYTPSAQAANFSTPALQTQISHIQQNQDPGHASILPPTTTGYSPTKHSPPRPSTSNGSFGASTPSALPPVASLTPSPQIQNLTPPVKPTEPERNRNGQSVGS